MKTYQLYREQVLPITIQEAWDFFSTAKNLAKITPDELGFDIITKLDDSPIYNGMLIEYRVRPVLGIPLKWVTKILDVEAPFKFADTQLTGPYKLWEHTHTFKEVPEGILMTDLVKYALPFGILGNIAHSVFVQSKLNYIFDYRKGILEAHFGK